MDCKQCNKPARTDSVLCRGGCGCVFHSKCLNLTDYDVKLLGKSKFLVIMCGDCQTVNLNEMCKTVKEMKDAILRHDEKLSSVCRDVKKISDNEKKSLEEIKKACASSKDNKQTYANVLKNGSEVVVVKPKNKQSARITKEDLTSNVNPLNIKIADVKSNKSGSVIVTCENRESSQKLKNSVEEKLKKNYDVQLMEVKKPRFKINRMAQEYSNEHLIELIKNQNEFLENADLVIKAVLKFKKEI